MTSGATNSEALESVARLPGAETTLTWANCDCSGWPCKHTPDTDDTQGDGPAPASGTFTADDVVRVAVGDESVWYTEACDLAMKRKWPITAFVNACRDAQSAPVSQSPHHPEDDYAAVRARVDTESFGQRRQSLRDEMYQLFFGGLMGKLDHRPGADGDTVYSEAGFWSATEMHARDGYNVKCTFADYWRDYAQALGFDEGQYQAVLRDAKQDAQRELDVDQGHIVKSRHANPKPRKWERGSGARKITLANEFRDWCISLDALPSADRLSPNARWVFSILLTYAQPVSMTAWPELRTIAAATGLAKSTVIRVLDELQDYNLVRKEYGPHGRGTNAVNHYLLRTEGDWGRGYGTVAPHQQVVR